MSLGPSYAKLHAIRATETTLALPTTSVYSGSAENHSSGSDPNASYVVSPSQLANLMSPFRGLDRLASAIVSGVSTKNSSNISNSGDDDGKFKPGNKYGFIPKPVSFSFGDYDFGSWLSGFPGRRRELDTSHEGYSAPVKEDRGIASLD
ncbi:hypothetical protein DL96DRAFT_1563627 [Flagelloscypha sp. PMI_526]|nr:hypothetical protein DL96DRAFT_1563627 [Flagelloscypha sp. PMI_526]